MTGPALLPIVAAPSRAPDYEDHPPVANLSGPIHAVYAHVPFCASKCDYCDFYSLAGHDNRMDAFLRAFQRECDIQRGHFAPIAPETIFIGGGTPTLLAPRQLDRLLKSLLEIVSGERLCEFTVEANPNTFDDAKAAVLAGHGVNRVSFGAQSFVPSELLTLQRDHEPAHVARAIACARDAGIENINIDLIFGIPGQTRDSLAYSLQQALVCRPEHVSCYSLMYEPNTGMAARLRRGLITACDEDLELSLFGQVRRTLDAHGLQPYEISNFARPGRACRHNLHYWDASNYLAFGPSAAAHHSGFRWKNVRALNRYLDAMAAGIPPVQEMERLTGNKRWGELAMLRLRTMEGISWAAFAERTGLDARRILGDVIGRFEAAGLVSCDDIGLRLTEEGVPLSDTVFADVLEAFDKASDEGIR